MSTGRDLVARFRSSAPLARGERESMPELWWQGGQTAPPVLDSFPAAAGVPGQTSAAAPSASVVQDMINSDIFQLESQFSAGAAAQLDLGGGGGGGGSGGRGGGDRGGCR